MDALMSAVRTGTVPVTPAASRTSNTVERYDFRRPSRVPKEQMRSIAVLHEEFAKVAAASLSGLLRTIVDLELDGVEETAYGEYVVAMGSPTCAFVFNMNPLKGGAVFELNPAIALLMIDRMLGGNGSNVSAGRALTEIECAVVERIGHRVMIDLQQAWHPIRAFTFRLMNLETNPQFIQATSPNEVILVATFRLRIGEQTGAISLGYPYLLVEPVLPGLGGQPWAASPATPPTPEARHFVLKELEASPLVVRAFLGRAQVSVRDVLNLHAGQLIPIEADARQPVRVEINGIAKFVGRPGTHRTHLAVEVSGEPEERSPLR
jgi:flagellar motor switch protein FliM